MTEDVRPPSRDAPLEPDPMLGRRLADRYRIDALVARGGMARVYRARDDRLDRNVAVKVLAPPYSDDAEFTERFLGEARAAASLSHPSLVHVYDSGSDGPAHYIVMELLDRHRSLRAILEERGRLPRDEVLRIGRELLAALRVVHERGLVHCDVKPANVMLGDGPAKLIDFGIATAPHDGTSSNTSIGSLRYMSPEQLHGESLSPSSDLFSLAATLYEALTGRAPYDGRTPEEVSEAQRLERVRPPSTIAEGIPGRLDEAIMQALRRAPASRFSTAAAMTRALEAAADEVAPHDDDDTTRVVRVRAPERRPESRPLDGGYVPPAVPSPAAPRPAARAPGSGAVAPVRRTAPARSRRSGAWGLIGTLLVLGAAALVVVFVVLPLLELGRQGGGGDAPSPSPTAAPTAEPGANTVAVPDLVGTSTADAIEAANAAGLNWTVYCDEDPEQPAGIIDQEPPAGTQVARGSPLSLYSARIADCR
jgi:serine/threonine-protein kinase